VPVGRGIVDRGYTYFGVDLSPRQIEIARLRVPKGSFIIGDAAAQDFEPNSFNAVPMLYAITHVPREHWSELLSRIRRWLQADGWLLINVPHHGTAGWLEEDFLGLGGSNWTNSYDAPTSLCLIEFAGFDIVDSRRLGESDIDPKGWLWVLANART
jgi:SAM-dependent methyltransferase